jgi:hypothetical protein
MQKTKGKMMPTLTVGQTDQFIDPDPTKKGWFTAPHGIWVDNEGPIYLAEVAAIWAIARGFAPPEAHRLQKFARVGRGGPDVKLRGTGTALAAGSGEDRG